MVAFCPLVITAYRFNFKHLFSYCYISSYKEVELTQSPEYNVSLHPSGSVTAWLNNSGEQGRVMPKAAVGSSEEKASFTAPVVINRTLLITHWGIKYSTDNRPWLSWRAPAMQRCWTWSWPWNSCSGLKHLSPQWARQTQPILPTVNCRLSLDLASPWLCQWHHQSQDPLRTFISFHFFFLHLVSLESLQIADFLLVCFKRYNMEQGSFSCSPWNDLVKFKWSQVQSSRQPPSSFSKRLLCKIQRPPTPQSLSNSANPLHTTNSKGTTLTVNPRPWTTYSALHWNVKFF